MKSVVSCCHNRACYYLAIKRAYLKFDIRLFLFLKTFIYLCTMLTCFSISCPIISLTKQQAILFKIPRRKCDITSRTPNIQPDAFVNCLFDLCKLTKQTLPKYIPKTFHVPFLAESRYIVFIQQLV